MTTRAVRGESDGMSSLPTSVTSATMASTTTFTTRGNESVGITRIPSRITSETDIIREDTVVEDQAGILRSHRSMRSNSDEFNISAEGTTDHNRQPRSRSQSPLTVQSDALGTSVASLQPSVGPSILSTAAVASSRAFGTRRINAAAAVASAEPTTGGRSNMADRVVSFTTNDLNAGGIQEASPQEEEDGSLTLPDELDTFSDIADAFSASSRQWREEYEARLDAIQKRM